LPRTQDADDHLEKLLHTWAGNPTGDALELWEELCGAPGLDPKWQPARATAEWLAALPPLAAGVRLRSLEVTGTFDFRGSVKIARLLLDEGAAPASFEQLREAVRKRTLRTRNDGPLTFSVFVSAGEDKAAVRTPAFPWPVRSGPRSTATFLGFVRDAVEPALRTDRSLFGIEDQHQRCVEFGRGRKTSAATELARYATAVALCPPVGQYRFLVRWAERYVDLAGFSCELARKHGFRDAATDPQLDVRIHHGIHRRYRGASFRRSYLGFLKRAIGWAITDILSGRKPARKVRWEVLERMCAQLLADALSHNTSPRPLLGGEEIGDLEAILSGGSAPPASPAHAVSTRLRGSPRMRRHARAWASRPREADADGRTPGMVQHAGVHS